MNSWFQLAAAELLLQVVGILPPETALVERLLCQATQGWRAQEQVAQDGIESLSAVTERRGGLLKRQLNDAEDYQKQRATWLAEIKLSK